MQYTKDRLPLIDSNLGEILGINSHDDINKYIIDAITNLNTGFLWTPEEDLEPLKPGVIANLSSVQPNNKTFTIGVTDDIGYGSIQAPKAKIYLSTYSNAVYAYAVLVAELTNNQPNYSNRIIWAGASAHNKNVGDYCIYISW